MHQKTTEQVGQFLARDSEGEEHEIIEFQNFIVSMDADDTVSRTPGSKFYRTADGYHVTRVDPKRYMIVESWVEVISSDPSAF